MHYTCAKWDWPITKPKFFLQNWILRCGEGGGLSKASSAAGRVMAEGVPPAFDMFLPSSFLLFPHLPSMLHACYFLPSLPLSLLPCILPSFNDPCFFLPPFFNRHLYNHVPAFLPSPMLFPSILPLMWSFYPSVFPSSFP